MPWLHNSSTPWPHNPIILYIEKVMYCKTENLVYVSFMTYSDEWTSYNKLKHP